jgi:hypothetical protein
MSLYMVIENFRNGDAVPVYRLFEIARGWLPPGCYTYQAGYTTGWIAVTS